MSFEALKTDFDVLKMNFVVRSSEKVAGEGDHGSRQTYVTQL